MSLDFLLICLLLYNVGLKVRLCYHFLVCSVAAFQHPLFFNILEMLAENV